LFQIDPRPYELAFKQAEASLARDLALVKQSEANLARDTAQAEQARSEAARASELAAQGIISKELCDRVRTTAAAMMQSVAADRAALDSAQTAVNADRVAIERARLDLSYCLIKSAIDGRAGPILVKQGNLVKANADTPMVTINQVRPIYVGFAVPEDQLNAIRAQMSDRSLDVQVSVPGAAAPSERGRLVFVDNTIDTSTGTIRLKARFKNIDGRLWPGQFVDVTLVLASQAGLTVVPSEAVQNGPNGQFIYVMHADQTVEMRPVTVGRTIDEVVVVEKGVAPSDLVVTDGHLLLTPGATVHFVGALDGNKKAAAGKAPLQ
jgi:multidrug efflux system membrane fusion protein